jgi:ABC-2 type transport system ATP-binding protein
VIVKTDGGSSLTTGIAVLALVAVTGARSSSSPHLAAPSPARPATASPTQYTRPSCRETRPSTPHAVAIPDGPSEYDVTSFDGTRIRVHWFPNPQAAAAAPRPTILKGPGWSQPGDTDTKTRGNGLFGDVNIASLWDAGYNVLTWDPRGFGKSNGVVSSDAPDVEGRDAQALLDWVAAQPKVQLDGPGDPRVGMVGGSYGGGIQLVLAAIDCRVDAIVPTIAWHSLTTSLYKAQTAKQGWADLLYNFAKGRRLDPHITSAHDRGDATGTLSAADQAWFASRGPGDLVNKINVPTLFVQGTVDTLFTLDEAVTNYTTLKARGVPTAMIWYCGGHGVCLTKGGDMTRTGTATIAWLARYVKDDTSAKLGPAFATVDQNGAELVADTYPPTSGPAISAHGAGDLALVPTTFAPALPVAGAPTAVLGSIAGGVTPARATNGVDVTVSFANTALLLGAPKLTITYSGTAPASARPTRVFAQLVDPATGLVLGNQITPIKVELDSKRHTTTIPLETVVFSAARGAKLTLQLTTSTTAYAQPRLGGHVKFTTIDVSLPTATGMRAR